MLTGDDRPTQSGHHWMLDLFNCACSPDRLQWAQCLLQPCLEACHECGMTVLKGDAHQFEPSGVTGFVLLSESHLAFHTWPELKYVALDIYVCDYSQTNKHKGERLVRQMLDFFLPDSHQCTSTRRGNASDFPTNCYREALSKDFGYWIQATPRCPSIKTPYQEIEVLQAESFGTILRLDGAMQYSDRDECCYHEPLVHMAMSHHPEPKEVLIIGGGDGGAARQALRWNTLIRLTHVEIDIDVLLTARRYLSSDAHSVDSDPRYRLHIEDGLSYVGRESRALDSQANGDVDVLILDLTDQGGPSELLYTETYFTQCNRLLSEQGVMVLHLAAPWFQQNRCSVLLNMLRSVFAQVVPFITAVPMSGGQWMMALCGRESCDFECSVEQIRARLEGLRTRDLQIVNPELLQAMKILPNYLKSAIASKSEN